MRYCARFLPLVAALSVGLYTMPSQAVTVVASIPPLAMIAEALVEGTRDAQVLLLVDGKQSPHGVMLLPSQRAQLARADMLFWVGKDFESWLVKPLETLSLSKLAMADVEQIDWLPASALQQAKHQQHTDGSMHAHAAWDMHLWLDPTVMRVYVVHARDELMMRDAAQADTYRENADRLLVAIAQADQQAKQWLQPVVNQPLLVMHDAWRYFFRHYGLTQGAMVQKTPEQTLGAASIAELEQQLRAGVFRCLIREPQFEPKAIPWVKALAPELKEVMANPLGYAHYPGGYPQWLRDQAKAMASCAP